MKKKIIVLVVLFVLLIVFAGAQLFRGYYDEPAHDVLVEEGSFEIRAYESRLVAETTVRAESLADASSVGFGRLAEFIFGANEGLDGESEKIAMTTPVESAPAGGEYTVVFTMPSKYTLETLPEPSDSRVVIRVDEPRTVATVRYSGIARKKDTTRLKNELMTFVEKEGYRPVSDVRIAQYDPPWIPGFFRRNELMVEIKAANRGAS